MDIGSIAVAISIIAGIGGVVFGVVSLFRNKKKDDAEDGKQDGIVLTELGYIKSGVDDLKRKQDKQDEQTLQLLRDLTAVQESSKQAHKRIDTLEERVNTIVTK
jgi:hypothetical protein